MSKKQTIAVVTKRPRLDFGSVRNDDELKLQMSVKGKTPNHRKYLRAIDESRVTICLGPAGTGKTWQAVGKAAKMLVDGDIKRIVMTRPLVTCGTRGIGYLPGDANEKVMPYMLPLLDAFDDFLGEHTVRKLIESGVIAMSPLELMRGSNIRDAFIICDEAQNAEYPQLHMFLTRFAKGSRVVITGDAGQTDLLHGGKNPLLRVIDCFKEGCHPEISIISMDHGDTMRDPMTTWIDRRLSGACDLIQGSSDVDVEDVFGFAIEGFEAVCAWCGIGCVMREVPLQFECWSCSSLTSLDGPGEVKSVVRSGVCTKTFDPTE